MKHKFGNFENKITKFNLNEMIPYADKNYKSAGFCSIEEEAITSFWHNIRQL